MLPKTKIRTWILDYLTPYPLRMRDALQKRLSRPDGRVLFY